jgi:hypothetical protein
MTTSRVSVDALIACALVALAGSALGCSGQRSGSGARAPLSDARGGDAPGAGGAGSAGQSPAQDPGAVAPESGAGDEAALRAMGAVGPLAPDCHDTKSARACPKDEADPTGRGLPTPGGSCASPSCRPCGSATKPAFRNSKGKATPGWCVCIPRSDNIGVGVYSCFTPAEWRANSPASP